MMTSIRILMASLLVLVAGCGEGMIDGAATDCLDPADCGETPTDPSAWTTPTGQPPANTEKLPDCASDAECTAPYLCNPTVGKCVPPSAKNSGPCDPIEGNNCPAGQQCISGVCIPPPSGCQTNENCPAGYMCVSGACVPGGANGQPGCKADSECPAGQICLSGDCKPKEVCTIPHAPNRLQGAWSFDSQLHVRDGLEGFTKGLLNVASTLQKIIEGKFTVSGVPSFLTSILGSFIQDLVKQYVPAWGQSVIALLADVNDVIDDTRVVSTETITALGNDLYAGTSVWNLVEFEYKGVKVSTAPETIPGLGKVTTDSYSAREVCGVLFIDNHKVKNSIGKLFRWAIEAILTGVTCTNNSFTCYKDLTMFNAVIDCQGLADGITNAAQSNTALAGLDLVVLGACVAQKQSLITTIMTELDELALKLTYMSLAAKANIASANQLGSGKWYGTLGGAYGKGNFEGTFTAVRK
jgi:hypothetical protein